MTTEHGALRGAALNDIRRRFLFLADGPWLRVALVLHLSLATAGVLVPAGIGWDFANFYDAGRRAAAGQIADLYHPERPIRGQAPQGTLSYWSPPISAFLYVPLAALPPRSALAAFKVAGTAAWMLAAFLLATLHRPHADADQRVQRGYLTAVAFALLLFQPVWAIYRVGGQTTPFVLLALTVALWAHVEGRAWTMAGAIAVACLVKPAFVIVPAWLLVSASRRTWLALGSVAVCVAAVSVASLGWPIHQEFLAVARQGATGRYGWPYNSSLYVVAESLGQSGVAPALVDGVSVAIKLAMIAMVLRLVLRARAQALPAPEARHAQMLLATTGALLVSQVVWEHYLAILLPLWSYLLAVCGQLSRSARGLLGVALGACLMQNMVMVNLIRHVVPADSLVAAVLLAVAKSLPLALTAIVLGRHGAEWIATYRAPSWQARAQGS